MSVESVQYLPVLPEIVVALGACAILVIDLFLPILQGTCCLLTGPPHSGRRTLLHHILRGHIASGGRSLLVIPALTATMRPRLAALLSAGATVIAAPWGAPPALRARARG